MIQVKITALTLGPPAKHRVSVSAIIEPEGATRGHNLTASAPRHALDGKERPINVCLEEAFADILRQVLGG